jgi:transketolase
MRGAFVRVLTELADADPRIVLLTGDLGFMVVEPFAERFPDRFVNVGVAEQDMVGIAAGLAASGFIPYTYSIATFATLRPYEFIRNGPILHELPVRIVGVGGGFEYGAAGPTHHGVEDLAVMRAQPEMTIVAPADWQQASTAVRETWELPGPVYLRLGKDDRKTVDGLDGRFALGRAEVVRTGCDLVMIGTGAITVEVVAAAVELARTGVECTVAVVASLNPPPVADLVAVLGRFEAAITVEAHSVVGGVGSLVCELVAEHGLRCRVTRCGIRHRHHLEGGEAYLNDAHGLSRRSLVAAALEALDALDGKATVSPIPSPARST